METTFAIASKEQALEHFKEGATVMCPSCKMKTMVVVKRERNAPPTHIEVSHVNEKVEKCAFMTVKE